MIDDKKYSDYSRKVKEANYQIKHDELFEFSPFSITEIQYLRGLIMADKLENNYEKEGKNALIDRKTTMHEFTEKLLKTLDELENGNE